MHEKNGTSQQKRYQNEKRNQTHYITIRLRMLLPLCYTLYLKIEVIVKPAYMGMNKLNGAGIYHVVYLRIPTILLYTLTLSAVIDK